MVPTCAYPIPLPFFKWRPTSDVVAVYPDDLPIPWSPSWTKWWLPTKTPPGSYTSPPNLKSLNPSKSSFWWCGRPSHKPFPIGVYSWLYRLYRLYPLPTYIFPGWFIIVAMLHGWFLIPDKSTNTHKHTLVWLWVLRLNPNWGGSKLHTHTNITWLPHTWPFNVYVTGAFFIPLADAMARARTGACPLNMLMPETPTWEKPWLSGKLHWIYVPWPLRQKQKYKIIWRKKTDTMCIYIYIQYIY